MVSDYLEIKVEIEEIVPYTNDTGDQDARYEVMHGKCGHEEGYGARNGECAAARN